MERSKTQNFVISHSSSVCLKSSFSQPQKARGERWAAEWSPVQHAFHLARGNMKERKAIITIYYKKKLPNE